MNEMTVSDARARRAPLARSAIDAMLAPESIAVVGASDDPGRVGGMPIAFLDRVGYAGAVYPVNPSRDTVQGRPAYPAVGAIGSPVDLAVVAVAAERAVGVVEECAAAGVRGAIVLSSGFAEVGAAGAARQEALRAVVARTGIRVCGPNCAGIMNVHERMTASFGSHLAADATLIPGSIAIVSQSGAVGAYMFTLARRRGLGLSSWVTTGNEVDAQVADFVAALAHDPATDAIAMYLEQVRDAEKLIEAAELACEQGKALVAILAGRSEEAEHAMRSHTAAMAGDRQVTSAALDALGIAQVDSIEDLLSTAVGLAGRRRPRGGGVGLVTISGAAGIMMVDRCAELDLAVPTLPDAAQDRLRELLPFAGVANPLDVTGNITNTPEIFAPFLEELLACEAIDSVVCFLGHVTLSPHVGGRLLADVAAVARGTSKPIWFVGLPGESDQAALLVDAGVPVFEDPVRAIEALAVARNAAAHAAADRDQRVGARRARPRASAPLGALPAGPALSETEAQDVLAAVGVPFPAQRIATSAAAAADAVRAFGGSAVLKILSPDIAHKTDIGGVRVGVAADEAAEAYEAIVAAARRHAPAARLDGVLVQELVDGHPVIVGTKRDETFGPVVLVGSGGIFTELLGDRALALAPLDRAGAQRLIDRTGLAPILAGARGGPPLARDALADLVATLSQLAWDERDRLRSIELNPVLIRPLDVVAVDALIEMEGRPNGG